MAIVNGKIKCSRCKTFKSLASFQPSIQKRGCGECRTCKAETKLKRYWDDPEKGRKQARETRKKWRELNKDRDNATARAFWAQNKRRTKGYGLAKYKLTVEKFERLAEKQNHECAICELPADWFPKGLFVDHCHETGKIRGLLCQRCNTGLGFLGDTKHKLKKALSYLEGAK